MLKDLENIERKSRVSSKETREITDDLYNKLATNYHRILQLQSMINTANVVLESTSAALTSVAMKLYEAEDNEVIITAFNEPIFPEISTENEQAERNQEFMSITAKRVNSSLVFTDDNGVILPSIELTKSIGDINHLEPISLIENSVENILKGIVPFVSRFNTNDAAKVNMELSIASTNQPLIINAIRYIPMPAMASVALESITYNAGTNLVMNGSDELEDIGHVLDFDRTTQGYIHFEPIETTELKFNFFSDVRLEALDCVSIGISKIVGENNTYALKSYIGWHVDYPDGYTTLTRITMEPATYATSLDNVQIKVYDSDVDFNDANTNYLVVCGEDKIMSIDQALHPDLYLLMEISSVNNTTPCVGKITLEFA